MAATETTAGWQLDEAGARAYERNLVPRFFDPFAADLLESLDLQPGQHLLDVACGTGIVARHAASLLAPAGQVTAIDISPAMLDVAREIASGTAAPISFEQADATQLPLADATVDTVVCQQGLQFVPDQPATLAEMFRVLAPGGRLAISTCRDLEHQPAYRTLVDVLTRHVGTQAAQVTASPFTLGDPDQLQHLLTDGGSVQATVTTRTYHIRFDSPEEFLVAETSSSPLGVLVDRLDHDVRDALLGDLTSALTPYTDNDRTITFPFQTLTVVCDPLTVR
jgi:ubiquinone/menaquinone biosynthesis C-methylase UbiE